MAIRQRVQLSLLQALELAVRNSPALAEQAAAVRERQELKRSVQGRFWPEVALELGGSYSQLRVDNAVWTGNSGIYAQGSPFLVQSNSWQRIQSNLGLGAGGLGLCWDLVNFERGAALAESSQELSAAKQHYANSLRALQLDVSLAYYGLQLAEQLRRVRQAVVENDTVVRDEVQVLKRSGLVPRLDLLRAEANLQQGRYQLGLASYTDVSDSIRQLTQAMESVAESVTLANVSYAQLLRELLPAPLPGPAAPDQQHRQHRKPEPHLRGVGVQQHHQQGDFKHQERELAPQR